MSFTLLEALQRTEWIDKDGRLLDDYGNLLLDEEGELTIIKEKDRRHFRICGGE